MDIEQSLDSEKRLQVHGDRNKFAKIIQTKPFSVNINSEQQSEQQKTQGNYKKPSEKKNWTEEKEKFLIDLYIRYGNQWKKISENFQNLNGTFLKNKFYSRLRKGIRTINSFITQFFSDNWEYLDCGIVFKLVNCGANKYDFSLKCPLGKKIQKFEFFPEKIVHQVYMLSFLNKKSIKGFMNLQAKKEQEIQTLIGHINLIDEKIEPKRSNRKKTTKIGKDKILLKQENFVTSNQIKIQCQLQKNYENHLPSKQNHKEKKQTLRHSREKMPKIKIVGINLDYPKKIKPLMIDDLEHLSQDISLENDSPKLYTSSHIRCSYKYISSFQQSQVFNGNKYQYLEQQDLKITKKPEDQND